MIPALLAISVGPRLFDGSIKDRYPSARHAWLLSIGMTALIVGVVLRMAIPAWQGQLFDLTWLGIAFFAILTFVILNRDHKDVVA
ncbi:hypothetical protein [Schlesneria paludicola]|uniref:hypothetical protein n=1 Tax=Schlesneria paludicola TaxID=360056 RepID=UPI0002ED1375|nr:hypothetical protein [Schlesneria paludicola]